MTAQMMDTLVWEDQKWALADADWEKLRHAAPSSESLGFQTTMEHTANYRGRTDTFEVRGGHLYLKEIRVHFAPGYEYYTPRPGMSRSDVKTQAWSSIGRPSADDLEWSEELRTSHSTYLTLHDCPVEYSGLLVGGRDFNARFHVNGGYQRANRFESRLILHFDRGQLVREGCRVEFGASIDAQADFERSLAQKLMARLRREPEEQERPH